MHPSSRAEDIIITGGPAITTHGVSFWVHPGDTSGGLSYAPTGKWTCGLYQCQIPRYRSPTNPNTGSIGARTPSSLSGLQPDQTVSQLCAQALAPALVLKADGTAPTHTPSQATFSHTLPGSTLALEVPHRGQAAAPSEGIRKGFLL